MLSDIESAESKKPLDGCDEDEFERNKKSMEENHNGVGLDVVDWFVRVVIQIVCIDQEVAAKYSWKSKAEEETLEIDNSFGEENQAGENSEPFEQISVGDGTSKAI